MAWVIGGLLGLAFLLFWGIGMLVMVMGEYVGLLFVILAPFITCYYIFKK
jgi:hypothetical protein